MNQKLIKLTDAHYIVVDDSEIKQGDWYLDQSTGNKYVKQMQYPNWGSEPTDCKKLTHSTESLEDIGLNTSMGNQLGFAYIEPLSLSEVEELIYGYSVEKMAEESSVSKRFLSESPWHDRHHKEGCLEGFKAHQELVKNKLFTIDDIIYIIDNISENLHRCYSGKDKEDHLKKIINSMPIKKEWEVEFIDGKIKLI